MWSPSLVPPFSGALLGIFATISSQVTRPQCCTSLLLAFSLRDSPPFGLALQHCFSCSLKKPKQSSCHLYAVWCVTVSQVLCYTYIPRGRSPLDFTAVKVILLTLGQFLGCSWTRYARFDTSTMVHLHSTPLLIPYKASTYKRLTLPWPWRSVPHRESAAPQGGLLPSVMSSALLRLINLPEQPLPIVRVSYYFFG